MGKTIKQLPVRFGLFELDINNNFMPLGRITQFEKDINGDIMLPVVDAETEYDDNEFELDINNDIMPRE